MFLLFSSSLSPIGFFQKIFGAIHIQKRRVKICAIGIGLSEVALLTVVRESATETDGHTIARIVSASGNWESK